MGGKYRGTGRNTGKGNYNYDILSEGKKAIFSKRKRNESLEPRLQNKDLIASLHEKLWWLTLFAR